MDNLEKLQEFCATVATTIISAGPMGDAMLGLIGEMVAKEKNIKAYEYFENMAKVAKDVYNELGDY